MIEASCHCGTAKLAVARAPRSLTDCNCSICRRYSALWAYYPASDVRLLDAAGAKQRSNGSPYFFQHARMRSKVAIDERRHGHRAETADVLIDGADVVRRVRLSHFRHD